MKSLFFLPQRLFSLIIVTRVLCSRVSNPIMTRPSNVHYLFPQATPRPIPPTPSAIHLFFVFLKLIFAIQELQEANPSSLVHVPNMVEMEELRFFNERVLSRHHFSLALSEIERNGRTREVTSKIE